MSPPDVIEVEGVLYPSMTCDTRPRTVRHACEEFAPEELDDLVRRVVGIPVCVEHDTTKVVGTVKCARRTASSAIWVTFGIDGRDDVSAAAIKGVRDGSLCGISLSHDYSYQRSAANRGTDCSLESAPLADDVKYKGPIELSVCADPARTGCHVHEVSVPCLFACLSLSLVLASGIRRAPTGALCTDGGEPCRTSGRLRTRQQPKDRRALFDRSSVCQWNGCQSPPRPRHDDAHRYAGIPT